MYKYEFMHSLLKRDDDMHTFSTLCKKSTRDYQKDPVRPARARGIKIVTLPRLL